MALLQFESVSFAYPEADKRALNRVSFSMEEGEYLVVCGESGCGKTTLLRMAKPQMTPKGAKEGKIFYQGTDITKVDNKISALKIGFVQQNPDNQIVTDYVWHELAFGLENMALPTEMIRRRVSEMASFFGMETWFRRKTCELSGGQKQMLNLASVLAMDPELLILDEPTSMLDPLAAASFLQMVQRINRDLGIAVLLCEQRLEEVFPTADRILLMEHGQVLQVDTPQRMAEYLQKHSKQLHMYESLPGSVRIFGALQEQQRYSREQKLPLTIRDARMALKTVPVRPDAVEQILEKEKKTEKRKPVLQAKELCFRYEKDSPQILRNLNLSLYKGELFALLGGNGAGKSTALKNLMGIARPQYGKVRKDKSLKLAMLPQSPQALFHYDTVWEEFLESAGNEEAKAGEMAAFLNMKHKMTSHPYDLSGGEMERAAIGKLLLQDADILLMDEPTKGLDAYLKHILADLLKQLTAKQITILMVTHDLEFAASYADRCGLLFDGQIISEDEPHQFFAGNRFYTTTANQIAGDRVFQAITCEEVIHACR